MSKTNHPIEKLVEVIRYKGIDCEVVERPEVLWVGCVGYENLDATELSRQTMDETIKRFHSLIDIEKRERINPDWSSAISLNFCSPDKPVGIMFAQEVYIAEQDERYDIITQPGGLWLRVQRTEESMTALLGEKVGDFDLHRFFNPLERVAEENGYVHNPNVDIEIEYHCHAEYSTPPHTGYAYIPIVRK